MSTLTFDPEILEADVLRRAAAYSLASAMTPDADVYERTELAEWLLRANRRPAEVEPEQSQEAPQAARSGPTAPGVTLEGPRDGSVVWSMADPDGDVVQIVRPRPVDRPQTRVLLSNGDETVQPLTATQALLLAQGLRQWPAVGEPLHIATDVWLRSSERHGTVMDLEFDGWLVYIGEEDAGDLARAIESTLNPALSDVD